MADAPASETPATAPPAPAPTPPAPAAPAVAAPAAPVVDDTAARLAKVEGERDEWKSFARKHERTADQLAAKLDQQDALLKTLAEKAGVEVDGKPDPEKLAAQLTSSRQEAQDRARELAIFRAAAGAHANADLLLDSRQFMARTADLDPTSADFADRVKALVSEAIGANPSLALAAPAPTDPAPVEPSPPPLPAASGGNFAGAPAGNRQWTQEDVNRATPEALKKAIGDGLLADLGIGRRKTRWR